MPPLDISSITPSLRRSWASQTKYVSRSNTAVKNSLATVILVVEPALRSWVGTGAGGSRAPTEEAVAFEIGLVAARTSSRIAWRGSPKGCDHRWRRMHPMRFLTLQRGCICPSACGQVVFILCGLFMVLGEDGYPLTILLKTLSLPSIDPLTIF